MMNLSKNLYVFMLALLIVASGCLGSGTTDGQDTDDEGGGTTVINNYYNNSIVDGPVWFTQGGTNEWIGLDEQGNPSTHTEDPSDCEQQGGFASFGGVYPGYHNCHLDVGTINTTAGEVLIIVEASYGMTIITTCQGSDNNTMGVGMAGKGTYDTYAAVGSAMDCTHLIRHQWTANSVVIWSLAYTITPATVVV